jgi:Fur family ferric uptake transcriptional regulator
MHAMHDHDIHQDGCDHGQGGESADRPQSRKTRQRDAIRSAVSAARRPVGPGEVLAAAQADVPTLGLATVYRNLRHMQEEGELSVVEVPGQGTLYEVSGLKHHHHFCCRGCGKVFDVQGCPGNLDGLVPSGFKLESHELLLYGQCAECARAA